MTENYKGYIIKIEPDESPESPREWDNLGKMVCFHSRYNLGDKHDYNHDDYSLWNELENAIVKNENTVAIFPLYLYDHSSLRIKIGSFQGLLPQGHAEFDSGCVGFIYATADSVKKSYGVKNITESVRAEVIKCLQSEVEVYDTYLSGDVVGYIVENQDGENLDSCWGFYDYDDALEEAKNVIDTRVKEETERKEARVKKYIQNSIPLIYRTA